MQNMHNTMFTEQEIVSDKYDYIHNKFGTLL